MAANVGYIALKKSFTEQEFASENPALIMYPLEMFLPWSCLTTHQANRSALLVNKC
jgi:hypothetical protein